MDATYVAIQLSDVGSLCWHVSESSYVDASVPSRLRDTVHGRLGPTQSGLEVEAEQQPYRSNWSGGSIRPVAPHLEPSSSFQDRSMKRKGMMEQSVPEGEDEQSKVVYAGTLACVAIADSYSWTHDDVKCLIGLDLSDYDVLSVSKDGFVPVHVKSIENWLTHTCF
jgi:hypothetical protein